MTVTLEVPIKGQLTGIINDIAKDRDDDDAILRANGHQSAMPRQFNWLSALGLGFSITNSWVGYLSCFGQNLIYGGAQACIFSLIVAFMIQFIVTLGLAELGSAFPSSGGQYHFCYILSPDTARRYSAYVVGWLSVFAWWIVTCSGISLAAAVLNGIVHFCSPGYIANQWQTYLTYVGVSFVTIIPVFAASNKISLVTQVALYLSLSSFVICLAVVIAMHQQMQPQHFLLQSEQGSSGWNEGTAWLLAISNAMYAFGGVDGVIHVSEEIPKPGKRVPQIMVITMVIGLLTCLPLFIVFMYFTTDMEAIREAPLPSLELVYQITASRSVSLGLSALLWVVYASSLPSQWVSAGRVAWAFARDSGTPFPEYFSEVNDRFNFPVRTTAVAFLFSCLYGLLYLVSTTAFNSIITSAVLFLNITYAIPQGILLTQGRACLPERYLKLGGVGYFCNAFSVLWIVVLGVLVCMPPVLPVSSLSMNYVCVILIGVFALINVLWLFVGKRRFEGPQIDWSLIRVQSN